MSWSASHRVNTTLRVGVVARSRANEPMTRSRREELQVMKKFAAFVMIVAVCAFTVGCSKTSKTDKTDKTDKTEKTD